MADPLKRNPQRLRRVRLSLSALILCGLISGGVAHPQSEGVVNRLDHAGLDKMMRAEGYPLLIVAVAAWCGPCREELPALIKIYDRYKDKGVKIIGLSVDFEGPEAMQPIVKRLGVNFPVYWVGEKGLQEYNIRTIPILFFVRNGRIEEKIVGKRSEAFIDQKVQDFLK